MTTQTRILLVGATGMLGSAILDSLLAKSLSVRVLLRPGKPEAEAQYRQRGIEVVHGNVLDPQSLAPVMQGIDVVVSALNNDPNMFVAGHRNLITAAEAAGVRRFVPSDFSVDLFKIKPEENFNLAMRLEVAPMFDGLRMRPIHILNGAFMDTMLDRRAPFIDWEHGVLPYFGDGQQLCDFTCVADAGRIVAEAVADPQAPEILRFAGEVLTMPQLAESIGRGSGTPLRGQSFGSVTELAQIIQQKQQTATNSWDWIALQYAHNMVSGRAKLNPLDNSRYPNVKAETVEQFAKRTRDMEVRGLSSADVTRTANQ